jgi:hypothetical protein
VSYCAMELVVVVAPSAMARSPLGAPVEDSRRKGFSHVGGGDLMLVLPS